MHITYHVLTEYEGNCPKCRRNQVGSFPEWVDQICWRCELEKIKKALIEKDITITKIKYEHEEGPYDIYVKSKGKTYIITAKQLEEVK